jgi:hypothetical protein
MLATQLISEQRANTRYRIFCHHHPALSSTAFMEQDPTRLVIDWQDDPIPFIHRAGQTSFRKGIRIIELHLNANRMGAAEEDILAIGLEYFHPFPDGSQPHNLEQVVIVVHSHTLFTRYNYVLVSPAGSEEVRGKIPKLLSEGGLSKKDMKDLEFKVNSTEKPLANALLGIRGVKHVSFTKNSSSRGKLEAGFEATIAVTLTAPSHQTNITYVSSESVGGPHSTPGLDHEGVFTAPFFDYGHEAGIEDLPITYDTHGAQYRPSRVRGWKIVSWSTE